MIILNFISCSQSHINGNMTCSFWTENFWCSKLLTIISVNPPNVAQINKNKHPAWNSYHAVIILTWRICGGGLKKNLSKRAGGGLSKQWPPYTILLWSRLHFVFFPWNIWFHGRSCLFFLQIIHTDVQISGVYGSIWNISIYWTENQLWSSHHGKFGNESFQVSAICEKKIPLD